MKTGRPRKENEKFKSIVKHIRYSPEEWEKVQSKLDETGLSFSEFIRRVSFKDEVIILSSETHDILNEIRSNLAHIGANINMLARKSANILDENDVYKFLADLENAGALAVELKNEIDKFKDALK